jgi:hypothetical protein
MAGSTDHGNPTDQPRTAIIVNRFVLQRIDALGRTMKSTGASIEPMEANSERVVIERDLEGLWSQREWLPGFDQKGAPLGGRVVSFGCRGRRTTATGRRDCCQYLLREEMMAAAVATATPDEIMIHTYSHCCCCYDYEHTGCSNSQTPKRSHCDYRIRGEVIPS